MQYRQEATHSIAARSLGPALVRVGLLVGLATALFLVHPVAAQSSGNGFLFKQPLGSFGFRAGFAQASAGSDVFAFMTDELTLGHGDFAGVTVGADLALRIKPQLDLVLGAEFSGSNARSEFRRFVDNNDLPIEQSTSLMRVPMTASAKFYLTPRGRSIGRFAWVPAQFAPFVGVGGGAMWYQLRQHGDFIDMETFDVFPDTFKSSGVAPTANGLAGIEVSLGPRFGLTAEGRYTWAKASLGSDFSGFDRIDLSGYNASVGLFVRF